MVDFDARAARLPAANRVLLRLLQSGALPRSAVYLVPIRSHADRASRLSFTKRALLTLLETGAVPVAAVRARTAAARAVLVPIVAAEAEPTVFCVPPVSGSPHVYLGLRRLVRPMRPLVALEAPGLHTDAPALERAEDLAAAYISALRERQARGPYLLLGWSTGGVIAFEMARQLVASGARVARVTLVDAVPPGDLPMPGEQEILARFAQDPLEIDESLEQRRFAVFRAGVRAFYAYRPAWSFPGRLQLIRAAESPSGLDSWRPLAAAVEEHVVPGDHFSMWTGDRIHELAAAIEGVAAMSSSTARA
jgi:thioesterase domain-containing protein